LASLIYELSLAKLIPNYFEESSKKQILEQLLDKFTPEKLQLLYQIATIGKRDLYLAPDLLAGFNMTLLRMLAFYPAFNANKKVTESTSIAKDINSPKKQAVPNNSEEKKTLEFDGNWRRLVEKLELGMAKSLAQESEFIGFSNRTFSLRLQPQHKHLSDKIYQDKLELALSNHFLEQIKIEITIAAVETSPAMEIKKEKAELLAKTEKSIMDDSFVKELINEFDAEVVSTSIQPKINGKES